MKELVEVLARALVDNPEPIEINEIEGKSPLLLSLKLPTRTWGR